MAAYSSVFKRVEKKYRIGAAERAAVEAAAGGPMAVDAYGRTRITSLYLDTPERSMIATASSNCAGSFVREERISIKRSRSSELLSA